MQNKFIKSTLILILGGSLTKLLSFIIKIYFTRVIGTEGINIYSIIMPTYSLLVTIAQLGFPIAIANVVAKGEKSGKNVIFSVVPVALVLNLLLIFGVTFLAKCLSTNLLHEPDALYPLICLSLVLPFISVASIIRGYFFGKQQMLPHSLSNILEQFFKFFIVIAVLPHLLKYGTVAAVCGYILISIITETISIIIFLFFLPKNFTIVKEDIKPDAGTIKDVLSISLPSVGGRIIGNVGYFLEPIILTFVLMLVGYSSEYIIRQYAVYSTYVIGILIVPSFLIAALSTALIPEITKHSRNKEKVKRIFYKSLLYSFILGLLANTFIFCAGEFLLQIIFHTSEGLTYIRVLAFFFTFYYLEAPMASALQALGYAKHSLQTTALGTILKLVAMTCLGLFKIGIYALVFAEIIFILVVVSLNYIKLKKVLN